MKHIFTIHSPITFLISLAVIEYKQIKKEDVVFLSRSYKVPLNNFTVLKSFSDIEGNFFKKFQNINAPQSIDKYINNNLNNEEFIVYADLMNHENRVLITNKKCKGFNFIEEGMSSYVYDFTLDYFTFNEKEASFRINYSRDFKAVIKGIIRSIRGYSTRINALPYNPAAYSFFKSVNFYCFGEDGFPHSLKNNKHVIDFNTINKYNSLFSRNISLKNEIVWIDDSFAKTYNLDINIYFNAIGAFIESFKIQSQVDSNKVNIKMRPRANSDSVNRLKNILISHGYEVSVLPNNIIIESLLLNSENCVVIGGVSSSLYYASLMGHISYSLFNYYEKENKCIFDDLECFWRKVKII